MIAFFRILFPADLSEQAQQAAPFVAAVGQVVREAALQYSRDLVLIGRGAMRKGFAVCAVALMMQFANHRVR